MDSPKIPTLKDSQKPQVKVRGLEAGVTLFDRLKQFKKKDLAFILAGLGTLFMAPLAEHFMMAPESGDATLNPGFSGKGANGNGIFNGGGSGPYDPGTSGLAPGGPATGGSDIITPLNVRDPSALVMGPGATQQPPAGSVAPTTPPPTAPVARNDSDLKDALAATSRAVGGAAKAAKALLPVPKVALSGAGGLRGLGVAGGGSSASSGSGAISANNVPNKASTGGGLTPVKALPGYRGVAGGRSGTQGGGGLEGLKKAAGDAGESMNRGPASAALDNTAAQAIPNGGSGFGGNGAGGAGSTDKSASGNQDKSAKNVGESLDFLKKKAMQEKQIELWAKEKEANDMNLQMAQWRNDALKTIVSDGFAKPLASCIGNVVGGKPCVDPTAGTLGYSCLSTDGKGIVNFPSGSMNKGCGGKDGSSSGWTKTADGKIMDCLTKTQYTTCKPFGGTGADLPSDGTKPDGGTGVTGLGPQGATQMLTDSSVTNLKSACDSLDAIHKDMETGKGNPAVAKEAAKIQSYADSVKLRAGRVVSWRDALSNGKGTGDCGAKDLGVSVPLIKQQNDLLSALADDTLAGQTPKGLLPQLAAALKVKTDGGPDGKPAPAVDPKSLPDAKTQIDQQITAASGDVKKLDKDSDPTNQKITDKPSDADFKKVYQTMYQLPEALLRDKVASSGGAFTQVDTAMTNVVKAAGTVQGIQKDLDDRKVRIDAASGPQGTVASLVTQDGKVVPVLTDAVFKRDGFVVGQEKVTADVKLSAGAPAQGLPAAITKAGKDLDAGITSDPKSFKNYAAVAKDKKNEEMFGATNGVLANGFQSLISARDAQVSELGELYKTMKDDTTKLSSAKTQAQTAQ